ncbi:hypothetical protein L218DRAFT_1008396 [Marasmius fiardii PR-910]|nr:hypothetical protein L218DRAFT_1008396 [Marasmius fiardii PR-910]
MASRIDLVIIRAWLYIVLFVFSLILFAICAARISFTNSNFGGYNPSVVEMLVTAILAMFWCGFMLFLFFADVVNPFIQLYRDELIGLLILWLLWIGGAAAVSAVFTGVENCQWNDQCRLLSALLAFAWLGWITLTVIIALSAYISWKHGGLTTALHGRSSSRAVVPPAKPAGVA